MNVLKQRLKAIVSPDIAFSDIHDELANLKGEGIQQQSIQGALEELRQETVTEAEEDRILEILDIVSGFCAPDQRIWED